MRLRFFSLFAAVGLIASACGAAATPAPATSAPTAAASSAASAAATVGATASAAASGGTSNASGTLTVSRFSDWYNFFHPVEFQTGNQFQWWNCLFNTLVNVDADSTTITPSLADTWSASADAKTYTFHLHPGIKWQDGTPFTAQDVIYSATWYAQNPDSYKGFVPVWGQIQGAAAIKGTTNPLTGITAPDDNTIVITLAAPNSIFLQQMTDMSNVILPEHILKGVTAADVEKVPFTTGTPGTTIGTGPYKLTAFTPDQSVEFTANPDYFKGAPKINKIVFKLFADSSLGIAQLQSGDLDLAFRVPPTEFDTLSAVPTLHTESDPNPGIVRIVFDTTKAPWNSVQVRQAFYYAINRAAIVKNVFQGRAHVLYNPPGFKVYDDLNKYDFNTDTAKQLLQTGGYSGQTFRLLYNQTSISNAVPPLMQSDLEAAGIKVQLVPTDNATYLTDLNDRTTWDGFIAVGGSEALSPQKSAQYFAPAPAGSKVQSGYTNPQIFKDWATALSSTDATVQDNAYHDLAKILNTDVPQINLYADDLVQAFTTKLGGGFKVHLNERETFMNVETWTLSQ
jgi:peptide/nickel transport system substrate-binding protein